jgi:tRNA-binding protein
MSGDRPSREDIESRAVAEITPDHFFEVDMRVGRIVEVEDFPEARKPAWKLKVDFGPEIGVRRSSAQITNYAREELEGRLVIGVVNFPPRQIGPVRSEVLVLGSMRGETVLLLNPEPEAELGDRIA